MRKQWLLPGVALIALVMLLIAVQVFGGNTARVQVPVNTLLGVRNNSATRMYMGTAVKPDTSVFALRVKESATVQGTGFVLPDTVTVTEDTLTGFVLRALAKGSIAADRDSIILVGTKPYDPGVSLVNGYPDRDTLVITSGGDTLTYADTWISLDSIYNLEAGANCNLDSILWQCMPLFGVSKADSADGINQIGIVGPSRGDSINAREWGTVIVPRIGGTARVTVNANTTVIYPWDKLRFGTSGWVKHTDKAQIVTVANDGDTTTVTPTESITDSTVAWAIDYSATTTDTTTILLKK